MMFQTKSYKSQLDKIQGFSKRTFFIAIQDVSIPPDFFLGGIFFADRGMGGPSGNLSEGETITHAHNNRPLFFTHARNKNSHFTSRLSNRSDRIKLNNSAHPSHPTSSTNQTKPRFRIEVFSLLLETTTKIRKLAIIFGRLCLNSRGG